MKELRGKNIPVEVKKEEIKRRIKELSPDGIHGQKAQKDTNLYTLARKYFGSLDEAIKAAGLKIPPKRYNIKTRGLTLEQKREITIKKIRENSPDGVYALPPSVDKSVYSMAQRYFGTYYDAVEAAGLKLKNTNMAAREKREYSMQDNKKAPYYERQKEIQWVHTQKRLKKIKDYIKVGDKLTLVNEGTQIKGKVIDKNNRFFLLQNQKGYKECYSYINVLLGLTKIKDLKI